MCSLGLGEREREIYISMSHVIVSIDKYEYQFLASVLRYDLTFNKISAMYHTIAGPWIVFTFKFTVPTQCMAWVLSRDE